MEQKPPKSHRQVVKRMVLSAVAGVALGLVCQIVPPQWQLPCSVLVRLLALTFGAST